MPSQRAAGLSQDGDGLVRGCSNLNQNRRYLMKNKWWKYIKKHHFLAKKCLFLMSKFHQKTWKIDRFWLFLVILGLKSMILGYFQHILAILGTNFMIFHENIVTYYPRKIIKMFRILMFFEVFYEIFINNFINYRIKYIKKE